MKSSIRELNEREIREVSGGMDAVSIAISWIIATAIYGGLMLLAKYVPTSNVKQKLE